MQQHQAQMARIAQAGQPHMVNGQQQRPPVPANVAFCSATTAAAAPAPTTATATTASSAAATAPSTTTAAAATRTAAGGTTSGSSSSNSSNNTSSSRIRISNPRCRNSINKSCFNSSRHNSNSSSSNHRITRSIRSTNNIWALHRKSHYIRTHHHSRIRSSRSSNHHTHHRPLRCISSTHSPRLGQDADHVQFQPATAHNSPMPNSLGQRPGQPGPIALRHPSRTQRIQCRIRDRLVPLLLQPTLPRLVRMSTVQCHCDKHRYIESGSSHPTHTRPPSVAPTPSMQAAGIPPMGTPIARPTTTSPTSNQLSQNMPAPNSALAAGMPSAVNGALASGIAGGVDSIAGAPGPNPQLQAQFPSGSGILRLLQYSEGLSSGTNRGDIDYWRTFVDEFFVPTGVFRLILWNVTSREQKGFEVPTCVLPRYLLTNYVSGLRSSQLQLENPREFQTGWPPVNPCRRLLHPASSSTASHHPM